MDRVEILGIKINNLSMQKAVEEIEKFIKEKSSKYIVTPNLDHLVKLQKDSEFKKIYNEAHLVLCDGLPIVWISRILGMPLKERVAGSDLFIELCKVSAQKGYKLFFLGGRENASVKASEVLRRKYPGIRIVGIYSPPFGFEKNKEENEKIIKMIKEAKPDILFVGLGAPKQEKWIYAHYRELGVPVSIGIGASFEFAAGIIKRAPKFLQKIGLEWFWRILTEPKRLWRRYLVDDMRFLVKIILTVILKKNERSR